MGNWRKEYQKLIEHYEKQDKIDPDLKIYFEQVGLTQKARDLKDETAKLDNVRRILGLYASCVLDTAKDLEIEGLEAGNPSAAIDSIRENLEKFKVSSKEPGKIQSMIQQLDAAQGIYERVSKITNSDGEEYAKLMGEIEGRINALDKGELDKDQSIIIPGGYRAEMGHAMLYKVTRDGIEIINTGIGAPKIPGKPEKTAIIKYSSPPLSKKQIMDFLREALKCMVKDANSNIGDVKKVISERLDKYAEPKAVRIHRHQEKGSCYMQAYLTFVRSSLPRYPRHQFELLMTKELDKAAKEAYSSLKKHQVQMLLRAGDVDKKIQSIFATGERAILRRTQRVQALEQLPDKKS
jgi:hypothetical protein